MDNCCIKILEMEDMYELTKIIIQYRKQGINIEYLHNEKDKKDVFDYIDLYIKNKIALLYFTPEKCLLYKCENKIKSLIIYNIIRDVDTGEKTCFIEDFWGESPFYAKNLWGRLLEICIENDVRILRADVYVQNEVMRSLIERCEFVQEKIQYVRELI